MLVRAWSDMHCQHHCSSLLCSCRRGMACCAGGPLGWLYPFEIQPLETRPAGGAVASLMNLLFSFVIGQLPTATLSAPL